MTLIVKESKFSKEITLPLMPLSHIYKNGEKLILTLYGTEKINKLTKKSKVNLSYGYVKHNGLKNETLADGLDKCDVPNRENWLRVIDIIKTILGLDSDKVNNKNSLIYIYLITYFKSQKIEELIKCLTYLFKNPNENKVLDEFIKTNMENYKKKTFKEILKYSNGSVKYFDDESSGIALLNFLFSQDRMFLEIVEDKLIIKYFTKNTSIFNSLETSVKLSRYKESYNLGFGNLIFDSGLSYSVDSNYGEFTQFGYTIDGEIESMDLVYLYDIFYNRNRTVK